MGGRGKEINSLSSTVNSLLLKMRSKRCFKSNGLRSNNLSMASSTAEIEKMQSEYTME